MPAVPLSTAGVVAWRHRRWYDVATNCDHQGRYHIFETSKHEIEACDKCGDVLHRRCKHDFKWAPVEPFTDPEHNFGDDTPFTELLLCQWCGLDGT